MQPSLHTNAVVQALVACRARRELRGSPNDTPEARQRVKHALWAMLETRVTTWNPASETLAQWALHVLDGAIARQSQPQPQPQQAA